ncbi:MAG: cytochrome b [Betaproteobacteria bacterium]|nr:cytochrome b [Betaproteobacteria bacterium]
MIEIRNTNESYGIIAQSLHWLVAALVLVQLGLGLYAASLPVSLARLQWLSHHKSLGLAILALVLLRLAWRSLNPPPSLPGSMPRWQRSAATALHWMLYLLLLLVPLAGWMHASAAGLSVNWFGLFQVPDLISKQPELSDLLKTLHKGCVALLAMLLLGHVGAALRHALVLRDGIAHRMLPWKPRRM